MQHVRVATYDLISGTAQEAADLAQGGMLDTFKTHHGFIGYSVLENDDGKLMSITVWKSHKDAEEAIALAAEWVKDNIADRIRLVWNAVGDALFNANALGS